MLYKCGTGDVLMDRLSQFCQIDSESLKRSRSDFELEVYSDSNWAGCNVTRKSTTSFMVFLCGNGEEKLENSARVTLTLHTDSSSAKAAWQRRGAGRLKHIDTDTRMLWLQRMLRKQYIRLQKVSTTYNPSDLNTKKLLRACRELLMSIIGVTDDREVLKFMPPFPKINGSVMRARAWFSAMILLVVILSIVLNMARSGSGQDGQRPNEDRGALIPAADDDEHTTTSEEERELRARARSHSDRYGSVDNPRIPPEEVARPYEGEPVGYRNELLQYIAMTGGFFAVIMEGTQYERDVGRRFPGQPLPDETTKVSLYQLELCTRAIMDRRLEPARTVLNLCAGDQENIPALLRGVDQLKEMFPNCVQQDARAQQLYPRARV